MGKLWFGLQKQKAISSRELSGSGTATGFYALTHGQYVDVTITHTAGVSADMPHFGAMTGAIVLLDLARTTDAQFCVRIARDTSLDDGYEGSDLAYTWTRRIRGL